MTLVSCASECNNKKTGNHNVGLFLCTRRTLCMRVRVSVTAYQDVRRKEETALRVQIENGKREVYWPNCGKMPSVSVRTRGNGTRPRRHGDPIRNTPNRNWRAAACPARHFAHSTYTYPPSRFIESARVKSGESPGSDRYQKAWEDLSSTTLFS
jgi:hypothetical protein